MLLMIYWKMIILVTIGPFKMKFRTKFEMKHYPNGYNGPYSQYVSKINWEKEWKKQLAKPYFSKEIFDQEYIYKWINDANN